MNTPCFYVTIIVDKIKDTVIAYPKVIESEIVAEQETAYTVKTSKTNGHLRNVKKEWVFYSETSAKAFTHENPELKLACDNAKNWLKDYLKRENK